jgi:flagellar hook protein FlgE
MLESIYVGMTGLLGYSQGLRVIANNTTNLNTPGFKSSNLHFGDLFYRDQGRSDSGGVQLGFGLNTLGTQLNFKQGDFQQTGNNMDLALDGQGLFVLQDAAGNISYTRAGQFEFDRNGVLTANQGTQRVMGLDASGNLVTINVSGLGTNSGRPTATVSFLGNLSSTTTEQTVGGVRVVDRAGREHTLDLRFTNTSATTPGSWGVELFEGTVSIGTASITFVDGRPTAATSRLQMNYTPAGQEPIALTLDFSSDVTSFASGNLSTLAMSRQDGVQPGNLVSTTTDTNGAMLLSYSNGQTTTATRLAIARFDTIDSLEAQGNNQFTTVDGRLLTLGNAGEQGFARVQARSIEGSNVDLSQEFSDLVVMQRGYQASSQVVTTANEMLQELFSLKRR